MGEYSTEEMPSQRAIMFLQNSLGADWIILGRYLGLLESEISHIKSDHRGDSREMCYQMLQKWLQMRGTEATVSVLADALRNSKRQDLADHLAEMLIKEPGPVTHSNIETFTTSVTEENVQFSDVRKQEANKILGPSTKYFWVTVTISLALFYFVGKNIFVGDGNYELKRDEPNELMEKTLASVQLENAVVFVKNSLTNEWRDVGRSLGLSHPDLEHINEEYNNNPKERNYHMLQKWREQNGKQATLITLEDALRQARRQDLADKLVKGESNKIKKRW